MPLHARRSAAHATLAALAALSVPAAATAAHAEGKNVLTVEFNNVGQVCLDGRDLEDLKKRLKELIVPDGTAITLVAYSDSTEFASKTRFEATSPCVKRAVPRGIGNHERLSTLRALQITEVAQELGLDAFAGTPLLLIGTDTGYRQHDANTIAIVADRSSKSGPGDRRVEIWITDAQPGGNAVAVPGSAKPVILQPLLLPPSSYAAAGGSFSGAPAGPFVPVSAEPDWQPWSFLGWSLVGIGSAGIIAGTIVLVHASDVDDRANNTLNVERSIALSQQASEEWRSGGWAVGLGGGLTLVGAALLLSLPGEPTPADPSAASSLFIAPGIGPEGASISVGLPLP